MRIVELLLGQGTFELHPRVTVLHGLGPATRARFVELAEALGRGELPTWVRGVAEAHGVRFDLSSGTVAALGLAERVDAVLRAADLPGRPTVPARPAPDVAGDADDAEAVAERQRLEAAVAALEGRLDEAVGARDQRAQELAAARRELEAARGRLEDARRRQTEVRRRQEESRRRQEESWRREAEARRRDDEARRREEEAAARPDRVVAEAGEARVDQAALQQRVDAARAELAHHRAEVARLRAAAREARASAEPLRLPPGDVEALERAHDAVLAAEDRVERSRVPNPRARRRLAKATQDEQSVLERLELPSYGAYLLRTSTLHVDPSGDRRASELEGELAQVEAAVAQAEEALATAEREVASAREAAQAETERGSRATVEAEPALEAGLGAEPEADAAEAAAAEAAAAEAAAAEAAADVAAAEDAVRRAADEAASATAAVAELEQRADEVREQLARARTAEQQPTRAEVRPRPLVQQPVTDDGDAEVYVLARLAGLRAAGCAGSMPMVVDDAFVGLPPRARDTLLAVLERLSPAVQILYLTSDDDVVRWGQRLGPGGAAVLRPPDG